MLNLSEILGRKLGLTTFPTVRFPETFILVNKFLKATLSSDSFREHLEKLNVDKGDWATKARQTEDLCRASEMYCDKEVNANIKNGNLPYQFNATEVFEMEMEAVLETAEKNGAGERQIFECLEELSDIYNERNIFLTQPYADTFYILDSESKVNDIINLYIPEDIMEETGTPRYSEISAIVRQFDLDEPIENDQHRRWVIKSNIADKPEYKNMPIREFFTHPEYCEADDVISLDYIKWVNDLPSMPYIADDVKSKYALFIDIYGRRVCCDEPQCQTNGKVTWINQVQLMLDNYGRPYAMTTYHDSRRTDTEKSVYSHPYTDAMATQSAASWKIINLLEAIIDENDDSEETKGMKQELKSVEHEATWFYLSHDFITHAVIGGLLRVTQWLNGDNGEVFIKEDVKLDRYERKRIKRTPMGQNTKSDEPTVSIRTLKVKPSLYVVEPDGTERKLKPRELAQHTRRGHFKHYGVNGKGLLFGKYIKSVYIKPTSVGKIENGLVIKDYELEGRGNVGS